jgi:hypothetical protein
LHLATQWSNHETDIVQGWFIRFNGQDLFSITYSLGGQFSIVTFWILAPEAEVAQCSAKANDHTRLIPNSQPLDGSHLSEHLWSFGGRFYFLATVDLPDTKTIAPFDIISMHRWHIPLRPTSTGKEFSIRREIQSVDPFNMTTQPASRLISAIFRALVVKGGNWGAHCAACE